MGEGLSRARLDGKVCVITGASSGIGEQTARLFAARGAQVVMVARRAERLEALERELPGSVALPLDVTDPAAPRRVRELCEQRFGRLDVLVNVAGQGNRTRFAEDGVAELERLMAVNLLAPVRLCEELLPLLRDCAPSSIVNVGSVAGKVGLSRNTHYSATKFALAGFSEALGAEESWNGVAVSIVLPGFVDTEGFPQDDLTGSRWTRWTVSTPEVTAAAILDAAVRRRPERYTPRPYWIVPLLRHTLRRPWFAAVRRLRR